MGLPALRVGAVLSALGLLVGFAAVHAAPVRADAPGQLILVFSRSIWQEDYPKCTSLVPAARSESLGQIATTLAGMGVTDVSASVVVNYTQPGQNCQQGHMNYASVSDLLGLQAGGWHIFSASVDHANMATMTDTTQVANESCNTIGALQADGFTHPEAQFDYPSGKHSSLDQSIVATCFDFARYYRAANYFTATSAQAANWLIPAYSTQGTATKYTSVATLAQEMTPPSGTVGEVQTYQLLDGDYGTPGTGVWWTCGATETHATSMGEGYCASDFYAALQQALAAGVTITDPYAVSQAWGRSVPGN